MIINITKQSSTQRDPNELWVARNKNMFKTGMSSTEISNPLRKNETRLAPFKSRKKFLLELESKL